MKKHIKTLCTLAILASVNQASAETFQLGVTGNIAPTACTPVIASNGVVDYGTIKTESLNKDDITWLDEKNIELNINCDAPAKVALYATSGRKGSALIKGSEGKTGAGTPLAQGDLPVYSGVAGFGMDGDKKIGAYGITFGINTKDGVRSSGTISTDKNNWTITNPYTLYSLSGGDVYFALRDGSDPAPAAFTTATFPLKIIGYVNKASELDISKPIKLDGLTNIEMVYL
ncbi:DUF1120 domain-containing protein [Pantoea dispersa]|uniref:DUF1120 domain-containing protein n=1 Tax=Pantoea dispersa TaxID=59814 RepID=UPI0023A9A471|nr:DUF1120 domain-containing protein [Pantoea dispersa]WEA06021.1 DUF1120 domain-containing protein [Pantoea dispersa]